MQGPSAEDQTNKQTIFENGHFKSFLTHCVLPRRAANACRCSSWKVI